MIVAELEHAVGERLVPARRQLCMELAGDVAAISGGMSEADRIPRRRGRLHQPPPGVVGAARAGVDQDHVDRLVQVLAVVDLSEPVRHRAVPADHPFSDLGKSGGFATSMSVGAATRRPPAMPAAAGSGLLRVQQRRRGHERHAGEEDAAEAGRHGAHGAGAGAAWQWGFSYPARRLDPACPGGASCG